MMGQHEAPHRDVSHKKSDEDAPSRRKPMQIVIPHATSLPDISAYSIVFTTPSNRAPLFT
jgi:hypothetical protein